MKGLRTLLLPPGVLPEDLPREALGIIEHLSYELLLAWAERDGALVRLATARAEARVVRGRARRNFKG